MKPYHLIIILFCLTISATAQKLNIPTGKVFEITTHTKDAGTYKKDNLYTYAFKSLGKNSDGNYLLEGKIVRAIIFNTRNGTILLNTDSIRKTDFSSTDVISTLALLNKPFTVVIDPKGELVNINGLQQIMEEALAKWNIKDDVAKHVLSNVTGGAFKFAINDLFYKPEKTTIPNAPQVVLKNVDMGSPFKITSIDANTVKVNLTNTTANGKYTREYLIDKQTGLVKSSTKFQDSKLPSNMPSGTGTDVLIKTTIDQVLSPPRTHTQPDTGWINMATKMSYWSTAFKKGPEGDSAKIYQLIKHPDNRFINDKYYLLARLQLAQSVKAKRSYLVYDSLLLATPNKYLEGNSMHLHNKLSSALYKDGAAAAYELSKYAYKTNAFDEWLQYSFSQAFANDDNEKREPEMFKKSKYLLALFKTNKDPVYLKKITPLYLWANAKMHKKDIPLMIETAKVFEQMGDKDMLNGNAGRYALLLYQMLTEAKQAAPAENLMKATLNKLERYTADTLNTDRYAHQNLLAGAYYLKYLREDAAGNQNATQYLANAAKYSPNSRKEKAYASNYDRYFLKTKESYRDVFINKLLNSGNEAEALKMFVQQLNAMPENITEMQEIYAKKFPGKDFKQFFADDIMGLWLNAPAFLLNGIDGKKHDLAEYKNKWLVLDFWGTWCGPCREEMPVVNKFSDDIMAGKYQNVNFLSIACNDTENAVKAYLEETKFGMPVAMSDGVIQKNYSIQGYPSKIIISPTGKMITVDFGKDWKKVITSFSQL